MNSRIFFIFLFLGMFTFSSYSQPGPTMDLKIKRGEFKTVNEEGFKEAWKNIKTGNKYFEEGIGTFSLARDHYLAAHQYNSEHPVLNYRIGLCYLYTDDKYEALSYMRKAYNEAPDLHPFINYYLGRAYHLVLEFDKAIEHYRNFREKAVQLGNVEATIEVDKNIIECNYGKEIIEEPRRVIISNLGDSVNSIYDDYSSVFTDNDSVLYFTSRRYHEKRDKRNPYDNKFYEDVYVARMNDAGVWMGAEPVSKKINKKDNNAVVGISPDGNSLYIYNGEEKVITTLVDPDRDYEPEKLKQLKDAEKQLDEVFSKLTQKHKIIYLTYSYHEKEGKYLPKHLREELKDVVQLSQSSIRVYKKEAFELVKSAFHGK